MRWLACFALALSFSLGPFSGRAWSLSSTESPREASEEGSSARLPTWERLDELLRMLEDAATDSSRDSERLRESLETARSELSELSRSLEESETRARELSDSLELCERSLELSEKSLEEARKLERGRETELWAWRVAAVLGFATGAFGLGYGLSR